MVSFCLCCLFSQRRKILLRIHSLPDSPVSLKRMKLGEEVLHGLVLTCMDNVKHEFFQQSNASFNGMKHICS